MHFTRIYHHQMPTKLHIHEEPLYGEAIRTKIKLPEGLQIADTEKCVADGTRYRFYANDAYAKINVISQNLTLEFSLSPHTSKLRRKNLLSNPHIIRDHHICSYICLCLYLNLCMSHLPWPND